jgi:dTDP-glucose 4,6-dehydratase
MRVNDGRAIPAFVSQALLGQEVTVFGKGLQTRSICYVDDLINGIEALLFSDLVNPVNIGTQEEVTMVALAREIISLTGSKSQLVFKDLPEDDPKVRQPDTTIARKHLAWNPAVDRKEGLQRTIEYFRMKLQKRKE